MGYRHSIKKGSYKKHDTYKCVYSVEINKTSSGHVFTGIKYKSHFAINGTKYQSRPYDTAREAALWYDMKRIEHKLEPVNILKPVK